MRQWPPWSGHTWYLAAAQVMVTDHHYHYPYYFLPLLLSITFSLKKKTKIPPSGHEERVGNVTATKFSSSPLTFNLSADMGATLRRQMSQPPGKDPALVIPPKASGLASYPPKCSHPRRDKHPKLLAPNTYHQWYAG